MATTDLSTPGARVRYLREAAHLSLAEANALLGLKARTHFGMLERRGTGMRYPTAKRVAEVFGVHTDWIYFGSGKRPSKAAVREAVAQARAMEGTSGAV